MKTSSLVCIVVQRNVFITQSYLRLSVVTNCSFVSCHGNMRVTLNRCISNLHIFQRKSNLGYLNTGLDCFFIQHKSWLWGNEMVLLCIAAHPRHCAEWEASEWFTFGLISPERYSLGMLRLLHAACFHNIRGGAAGWTHDACVLSIGDESRDACQLRRG